MHPNNQYHKYNQYKEHHKYRDKGFKTLGLQLSKMLSNHVSILQQNKFHNKSSPNRNKKRKL